METSFLSACILNINVYFSLGFACMFDSPNTVECLLFNFFNLILLGKVRSITSRHILDVLGCEYDVLTVLGQFK